MTRKLGKYSFGIGDRFAHQAEAQLNALIMAFEHGIEITPVWNKSYREHQIIGSVSATTRTAADESVKSLNWPGEYFLDADHINLSNVDFFSATCDFFTIDVADYIGRSSDQELIKKFCDKNARYIGQTELPGSNHALNISSDLLRTAAEKYLFAATEAGRIYRHITGSKAGEDVIIEVSMDETDNAQTPEEIFLILAAIAAESIPVRTIAPKFTGRFNKGVDYVGDVNQFRLEFEQDVAALQLAVTEFGLPANLKLSVHSGSDKFSIYPIIKETIHKYNAGIHVKTAGTTWLEEVIGLAAAGGSGLDLAKRIYHESLDRFDELCSPYANVLDIDKAKLPTVDEVNSWDEHKFVASLRHVQSEPLYNLHFRQLIHVGYKVAAEMGSEYLEALKIYRDEISKNVTENLFDRHIKSIFI